MELLGITNVDFDIIDQQPMIDQVFYVWQILEEKREYNGTVHQLLTDFKKSYDSLRREILYNILIEVGIIKMCLN
jgi:hypothetical protein